MITGPDQLPAPIAQTFIKRLLSIPVPSLIHKKFAMLETMPRHGGKTVRFRRMNKLATAKVPLGASGLDPAPQVLSAIDIDATMSFYGTFIQLHEQVVLQNQDKPLTQAAEVLGISLRMTEDELTRDMLASTASAVNATGGTNGDSPTEITPNDVSEVARALLGADASTIADMIEGQDKFGTAPVRNSFFCMSHTDMTHSLNQTASFLHASAYPNQASILSSEYGAIGNIRFFVSSVGSKNLLASALTNTVYNNFIVGMEAYASIKQDGYSAQFIYRAPIYCSSLALFGEVGYRFAEVPRILNDMWIINLRTTMNA